MISASTFCLTAFLILLSWHLGLSMELTMVSIVGTAISLLAGFRLLNVERPTWGLVFVLLATGAFTGNQILEDWAIEGSWPQENGLGAGLVIGMLIYLIWVFAARDHERTEFAIDRDTQTILVVGLLLLLLMAPPENTVVFLLDERLGALTLIGIVLASLTLLVDHCGAQLRTRLLLLLPVLFTIPLFNGLLEIGQRPAIGLIGNLMPSPRSFTPTGFSPSQQLNASSFLRPSSRAVMRIHSEQHPGRYLVGNRLSVLDEGLVWRAVGSAAQSLSTFDAELTESNNWRYPVSNVQSPEDFPPTAYTVHSLNSDYFVFSSPATTHISGQFEALEKDPSYSFVWTADFERGADRRWQIEAGGQSQPDTPGTQYLLLPSFWDGALQTRSEEFAAPTRADTVQNMVRYFTTRNYSLRTDFDNERPFHDFFLNDQPAYCFWFATGAALAMRANGIPSRLVSGYAINEQISSEIWLVRDRDAHSWVEWQDENGYWHTVDPTPPSIEAFFGGYQSSPMSQWYHYLAGEWQNLIDRILADEMMANLVRFGGIVILIFLFVREYRRLRSKRQSLDTRSRRWQKLWQRFLQKANLPVQPAWTASAYADSLPTGWTERQKSAVRTFLSEYERQRFAPDDEAAIKGLEKSLDACIKDLAAG